MRRPAEHNLGVSKLEISDHFNHHFLLCRKLDSNLDHCVSRSGSKYCFVTRKCGSGWLLFQRVEHDASLMQDVLCTSATW